MAAPIDERLCEFLQAEGVRFEELTQQECWQYQQRWRECYCARLKKQTGKWTHGEYDWHTFSFGFARSKLDTKAMHEYQACSASEFLILPERDRGVALRCCGPKLPDLRKVGSERYVFPPDLEWTMVFSHEGPFFSRKAWQ